MRTVVDGHCVICDKSENSIWQESLLHHENFTLVGEKGYDSKGQKGTDVAIAEKLVSNIIEAQALFRRFQQELVE